MRTIVFLLLIAAFSACATSDTSHPLGDAVAVRFSESASFHGGLRVTFTELVGDSRCPINVTCIQAGEAEVRLNVSLSGRTETITLSTDAPDESVAAVPGYRIELVDVTPVADGTQRAPDAYSVTVRVQAQ
jgi:hypothetical protein